jgi:hypothetical protein
MAVQLTEVLVQFILILLIHFAYWNNLQNMIFVLYNSFQVSQDSKEKQKGVLTAQGPCTERIDL